MKRAAPIAATFALVAGLALAEGAAAAPRADDEPMHIALSTALIEIDSSFTGTSILLFGSTDVEGDIAVTVRGPESPVVVRRKRRSAGLWINRDSVAFRDVPGYYAAAASTRLADAAPMDILDRAQIGTEQLLLEAIWIRTEDEVDAFRAAVIRDRQRQRLYGPEVGPVTFIDDSLFHTTLAFPANVPIGDYRVEAFLLRDGEVLSARDTQLRVEKSGFSADISAFARTDAALYGIVAIALALVAGWIGSFAFRKG